MKREAGTSLPVFQREMLGQLSSAEIDLQFNQLRASLLEFINRLKADDLVHPELQLKEKIKSSDIEDTSRSQERQVEKFLNQPDWDNLEKIGLWTFDSQEKAFEGSGMYQYLLSKHIYGQRNFTVLAKLTFSEYQKHASKHLDNANTGIIFGWLSNNKVRRYFNLLLTGKRIVLEGVGLYGGDDYRDFIHFDNGVNFSIDDGREYSFSIHVGSRNFDVFVDNEFVYSISKPEDFIGRVGLRPWRANIRCRHFEIQEN